MSTHIVKLVLALMMSLCIEQTFAQTTTGQQCKALLNPVVDQLFSYQYRANYYSINNEIPNVIATDLEVIAAKESSTDAVKNYVQMAKSILNQCKQSCHGLSLSNNQTINCALMGKTNPRELRLGLALLTDNSQVAIQAEQTADNNDTSTRPSAACSFEPERLECVIADQGSATAGSDEVQTTTNPAQYANESLEDVYRRHADQLNETQYKTQDRENQKSVW